MTKSTKILALAAASAGLLATFAPASAAPAFVSSITASAGQGADDAWQHSRRGDYSHDRYGYRDRPYPGNGYYGEPVYRDTRVWRGRDGRTYCRKRDGTVGLIIGGAVGALLGREIDGGYNRATGTIIGGAAGALLGRSIARDGGRCR